MTLRIERVKEQIRLSGEFRVGDLDQVRTEIERCKSPIVLDLAELDLIDLESVRFLNACELAGVSILHCSPYIREWMLQERSRPKDPSEALTQALGHTNDIGLRKLMHVKRTEKKKGDQ